MTRMPSPQRAMAWGACSRLEPQPKFWFTRSTWAPANLGSSKAWVFPCSVSCSRSSSKACSPRPSKVTVLRKRAGMMRSVSMSLPRTGMARPRIVTRLVSIFVPRGSVNAEQLPCVGDLAGDRGGGDHRRAHEQGASGGRALPSLEVAVGARGAQLAPLELVGVHRQAHGAAGLAELEAGRREELVVAALDRRLLHLVGAGDHDGPHALLDLEVLAIEQPDDLLDVAQA